MGFTWFKKGTFDKLANLVRSIGYPIALQNKLDESLGKDYLPQETPSTDVSKSNTPITDVGFQPSPPSQIDENKTLSENIANLSPQTLQETPVPTTTGTPTKDLSGIQTILQSQESAKSWNKKVQRDYLDFLKYATKFGEQGKQYTDMANYLAQGSMKEIPKLTNIDPKQVMKDKNGDAYMLYLNPMGGTVKQPLGVKFDEIVQPKFNKDMLHFEMGDDGNAVIRNLENGTTVNTGIPFGQFDTKWDIQNKLYNLKEAHDLGMLDIAQQKLLKSGKGGNGEGDGNAPSPTKENQLMYNGEPVDLFVAQKLGIGDLYKNLYSGSAKTQKKARETLLSTAGFSFGQPKIDVSNPQLVPGQDKELTADDVVSIVNQATDDYQSGKITPQEYYQIMNDKLPKKFKQKKK